MTVEYRDETPFTGDNHTPTELANAIRTKKYGKAVREPIAQLAGKLDSAIKGRSIGNVVATPTKVFANLSALQSAYPNGADGVMVTTDNGHKYFWEDTSWVDGGVYQAQIDSLTGQIKSTGVYLESNPINFGTDTDVELPNLFGSVEIEKGDKFLVKVETLSGDFTYSQLVRNGQILATPRPNAWIEVDTSDWANPAFSIGVNLYGERVNTNGQFILKIAYGWGYEQLKSMITQDSKIGVITSDEINFSTDADVIKNNIIPNVWVKKGDKLKVKFELSSGTAKNIQLTYNNGAFIQGVEVGSWVDIDTSNLDGHAIGLGINLYRNQVTENGTGKLLVLTGDGYDKYIENQQENYASGYKKTTQTFSTTTDTTVKDITGNVYVKPGAKVSAFVKLISGNISSFQLTMNNKKYVSAGRPNTWLDVDTSDWTAPATNFGINLFKQYATESGEVEVSVIYGAAVDIWKPILQPDDSETEDNNLPEYYTQAWLSQKIDEINTQTRVTNGLSFVYFTDSHFGENSGHSGQLVKEILDRTSVPFALCGGDFVSAYGTKDDVYNHVEKFREYQNLIGKDRLFTARGNHDLTIRDRNADSGYTAPLADIYDYLVRPTEFYNPSIQPGKLYYHIDIPAQRTRIIVLDSTDTQTSGDNLWAVNPTFGQEQADWLVSKLMEVNNHRFIILSHVPIDPYMSSYGRQLEPVMKILQALKSKTSITGHFGSVDLNVDFSNTTNELIFVLGGHSHLDESHRNNSVLSITTTSDAYYRDDGWWRISPSLGHIANTVTEQGVDVFTINFDDHSIKTVRLGSGKNRVFDYKGSDTGRNDGTGRTLSEMRNSDTNLPSE